MDRGHSGLSPDRWGRVRRNPWAAADGGTQVAIAGAACGRRRAGTGRPAINAWALCPASLPLIPWPDEVTAATEFVRKSATRKPRGLCPPPAFGNPCRLEYPCCNRSARGADPASPGRSPRKANHTGACPAGVTPLAASRDFKNPWNPGPTGPIPCRYGARRDRSG